MNAARAQSLDRLAAGLEGESVPPSDEYLDECRRILDERPGRLAETIEQGEDLAAEIVGERTLDGRYGGDAARAALEWADEFDTGNTPEERLLSAMKEVAEARPNSYIAGYLKGREAM